MTRALIAVAAALALPACSRPPSRPPNVVLLIIDTLRADALGCYNEAYPDLSPEIDALARRGVTFLDVTAQSSWTRPSVASLLTSTYPRLLGVHREKYDLLPDEFVTLAEALRAGGYETVGITANPNLNEVFNFHQGFDRYVESEVVWDWMQPGDGQKQVGRKQTLPDSRRVLQAMVDQARSRRDPRPLYMQAVVMEVHEGWKLVRPEFQVNYRGLRGAPAGYWDGVRQVSFDVGRFVEQLSALPGWDDALFVITSDHGQGLADHPDVPRSWGHGLFLYDSHVKVPLVFYTPARAGSAHALQPRRIAQRVTLMDVMPTVLAHVNVRIPPSAGGRSLRPLLAGGPDADDPSRRLVTETYYDGTDKIAVHSTEWTYVENRDGQEGVNPRELQRARAPVNGAATDQIQARPDVAGELAAYLRGWERGHARRPPRQPAQGPGERELDQLRALGYVN